MIEYLRESLPYFIAGLIIFGVAFTYAEYKNDNYNNFQKQDKYTIEEIECLIKERKNLLNYIENLRKLVGIQEFQKELSSLNLYWFDNIKKGTHDLRIIKNEFIESGILEADTMLYEFAMTSEGLCLVGIGENLDLINLSHVLQIIFQYQAEIEQHISKVHEVEL